jgi:hypothetical protein
MYTVAGREITEKKKKRAKKHKKARKEEKRHQVKYPANRAICMSRAYSWKMYTW